MKILDNNWHIIILYKSTYTLRIEGNKTVDPSRPHFQRGMGADPDFDLEI